MFPFFKKNTPHIHLDYAATTPVAPQVFKAMQPYFSGEWANPNAIYASGVRARKAVEKARTEIARLLRIRAHGIVFTSGGTESNNLALRGLIEALHEKGRPYDSMEIITTPIEHPSILETCEALKKLGVVVHEVSVTEDGKIGEHAFTALLSAKTALVTFAYVNSEIGVIQDVKRLTRLVRAFNTKHGTAIKVHLDAAQAPLWLPCEMDAVGVDLMSLDAGKCFGPKGVGVLALRHGVTIVPIMYGGGQEGGLRAGTENVPLVVGCAKALSLAIENRTPRSEKVRVLRDYFIERLLRDVPGVVINGSVHDRVPNNVHISLPGIDSEYTVITLDREGIAASTRSACGSKSSRGSYVVRAITQDEVRATSTVRFTLSDTTTKRELSHTLTVLKEHVLRTRTFYKSLPKPI